MNRTELIAEMAQNSGLTKKDSEAALKALLETISEVLQKREKLTLVGFGSFEAVDRAERKGINPKTKEEILIPATTVPKFKAGSALKEKVNGKS